MFTTPPALLLFLLLLLSSHQQHGVIVLAKVVNPYDVSGKPFRVEPAAFGSTLSEIETVKAHLQVVKNNPTLCPPDGHGQDQDDIDYDIDDTTAVDTATGKNSTNSTRVNSTRSQIVVEPSDGLPVVLLARYDGDCFAGEIAKFVDESLKQNSPSVKYLLVHASSENIRIEVITLVSSYETDLGILFISQDAGKILHDYINEYEESQQQQEQQQLDSTTVTTNNANLAGPIIEFDGSLPDDYIEFRKKMAIFPKFSGALSMMGSSYIIYNHVGFGKDRVKELHRTFNRVFFLLAISDIFSSFGVFLSTWMIPKVTDEGYKQYVWDIEFPYASGNDATCSFQGFLIHFGFIASVLLTAFIAIQFVLQVRYRWTEKSMRKAEKVFFVVGVIFPLVTAIALASVGAFNPTTNGFCHINTDPYTCYGDDDPMCLQDKESNSDWIWALQTFTATIWIGLSLLTVIISMILLFCTVRSQELRAQRWIAGSADGKRQKMVIVKAFYYIGAFILVWLPTVLRMTDVLPYGKTDLVMNTILPLQGLFNAIIYSNGITKITKFVRNFSFSRSDNSTTRSSYFGRIGETTRSYLGMITERSVGFFTFRGRDSGSGSSSDPSSDDDAKNYNSSLDDVNNRFLDQNIIGHSDLESYESSCDDAMNNISLDDNMFLVDDQSIIVGNSSDHESYEPSSSSDDVANSSSLKKKKVPDNKAASGMTNPSRLR